MLEAIFLPVLFLAYISAAVFFTTEFLILPSIKTQIIALHVGLQTMISHIPDPSCVLCN